MLESIARDEAYRVSGDTLIAISVSYELIKLRLFVARPHSFVIKFTARH